MSDKKDFKSNDICDEFYADAPGLDPDLEWNEEKDYLDKDVEQKLSNIEQLFTDEGSDFYWDTLYLADELFEQGKYEEAEELYKKIAGDQDATGDANAHYGYLLDKMGRYAEAFDCFARVLYGYADTSPRDGVADFLCMSFLNEDSPYWRWCWRGRQSGHRGRCQDTGTSQIPRIPYIQEAEARNSDRSIRGRPAFLQSSPRPTR